ncbi:unnamed protein product, partial [Aphanomyces euteiches]
TAIYIAGKGLEGHIDGSIEEPLELPQGAEVGPFVRNKASPTWQRWRQDNMKCVDKIRKRLSLEIPDDIGDATITAKELWDLLQSRYGRATGYARAMAMRDIYMCQMKSGKSVSHHLANVSRLVGIARQYGCNISCEDEAWSMALGPEHGFKVYIYVAIPRYQWDIWHA